MNHISEVIGWKFNHQEGMTTKGGVITEFPGGIPSQSDQDTWTAEYEARDIAKERVDKAFSKSDRDVLVSETLFDLENRVRKMEGLAVMNKAEFNINMESRLK